MKCWFLNNVDKSQFLALQTETEFLYDDDDDDGVNDDDGDVDGDDDEKTMTNLHEAQSHDRRQNHHHDSTERVEADTLSQYWRKRVKTDNLEHRNCGVSERSKMVREMIRLFELILRRVTLYDPLLLDGIVDDHRKHVNRHDAQDHNPEDVNHLLRKASDQHA